MVVTARGTDWSLALLVAIAFVTGLLTLFAGEPGEEWVFAIHGIGGVAVGGVLVWEVRRVWRRVLKPERWDRRTGAGLAALTLVATVVGSGIVWAAGGDLDFGGFGLLNWHFALGALLAFAVLVHALWRARRPKRVDLAGRRQLLLSAGVAAGAVAVWQLQRPVEAFFGLRGAKRRFTGSYEADSFAGNAFPSTSWVSDGPRAVDLSGYRLAVRGLVDRELDVPLAQLDARDALEATLDCTGGFYSRQRWRGISLGRLIDRAGARPGASDVRVVSRTGYRWSFGWRDARELLLATRVGDEPLSHEHGAPVRLVAPGRRGFQWVKWIERIELHDEPDPGAPASTIWSSFTEKG